MIKFPDQPDLRPIKDELYKNMENYSYEWQYEGRLFRIIVPAGFKSDGASVPRLLWSIIRPDGMIRSAALIHDFIDDIRGDFPLGTYEHRVNGKWRSLEAKWEKKEADRLFCRIMRESNVPKWKRRLAYRMVRLFGWIFW